MKHLRLFENFDKSEVYYHGTRKDFTQFKMNQEIENPTYGGAELDQGLGIFFTDNMTIAKWFAGLTEYDPNEEGYVDKDGPGRVISASLDIKNPWILNDQIPNAGDDPGQDYFDVVKKEGGGRKFRDKLIAEGYDSVIVRGAVTNYYEDGSYDIIVVFDPKQIQVISKNV